MMTGKNTRTTKKFLQKINFSNIDGQKIDMQKTIAFYKQAARQTLSQKKKKRKHLRQPKTKTPKKKIKNIQDLYEDNFKTFMQDIRSEKVKRHAIRSFYKN